MKSQNGVCSLELSKKLSHLGVNANSQLTWVFDTLNGRWDLSGMPLEAIRLIDATNQKTREAYSAYSTYELGKMFGSGTVSIERLYNNVLRKLNQGLSFGIVFEPDFLAKELIYSIVNNFTTSIDCEHRLTSIPFNAEKAIYK